MCAFVCASAARNGLSRVPVCRGGTIFEKWPGEVCLRRNTALAAIYRLVNPVCGFALKTQTRCEEEPEKPGLDDGRGRPSGIDSVFVLIYQSLADVHSYECY